MDGHFERVLCKEMPRQGCKWTASDVVFSGGHVCMQLAAWTLGERGRGASKSMQGFVWGARSVRRGAFGIVLTGRPSDRIELGKGERQLHFGEVRDLCRMLEKVCVWGGEAPFGAWRCVQERVVGYRGRYGGGVERVVQTQLMTQKCF